MIYLLDTNTCIKLLNEPDSAPVARKLRTLKPKDIRVCTVVESEMYYGAYRSSRRESNLIRLQMFFNQFVSLPFDRKSAIIAGQIRAYLAELGTPIGPYDLLIAAIGLANHLTVVTNNTGEFKRVPDLTVESWG
jgi:tRNA(fMet)-specific endonuclease VapC